MRKPYVIAINSVSGGGKTALATLLKNSLPKATLFCFDDLDKSHHHPTDFHEWFKRGGDLLEFDCRGMNDAVGDEITRGSSEIIVLDYPFGRDHPKFRHSIDLSVFIDVPLDVAMARRILRDYVENLEISAEERLKSLKEDLSYYSSKARHVYLNHERRKESCDLILDGWTTLGQMRNRIMDHIQTNLGPF
jgi:uridine kinase